MTALSTKNRKQLDQFLFRIMEPLSEEALTDTHYNHLVRNARREVWEKARLTTNYLQAKRDLAVAEWIYSTRVLECSDAEDEAGKRKLDEATGELIAAIEFQITTPAPDLAAINWKKHKLKSMYVRNGSINPEQIKRRIEEDEAFLAAHPLTKRPRRGRRSSGDEPRPTEDESP